MEVIDYFLFKKQVFSFKRDGGIQHMDLRDLLQSVGGLVHNHRSTIRWECKTVLQVNRIILFQSDKEDSYNRHEHGVQLKGKLLEPVPAS